LASEVDIGRSPTSPPANPEPSPKKNVVAHEVRVTATGARPSEGSAQRELFSEDTTSVLVFENGGVIRLSAAVIPGQLLFLTHQESKREVVAQVTLKRDNRPTSCYVELEFTEPSPGFWGIDFPKLPPHTQDDEKQIAMAELVQSAETTIDDPGTPALAPDLREVERLKLEVEALRRQLQSLRETQQTAAPPAVAGLQANPVSKVPTILQAAPPAAQLPPVATTLKPALVSTPTAVAEPVSPKPSVPKEEPPIAEEDLLPKPALDFEQVAAKDSRYRPIALAIPAGSGSLKNRLGFLSAALLLVTVGAAWKMHWLPWSPPMKNFHLSMPSNLGRGANSVSAIPSVPPKNLEANPETANAKQIGATPPLPAVSAPPESLSAEALANAPRPEPVAAASDSDEQEPGPIIVAKPLPVSSTPKRILLHSSNNTESVSATSSADASGFVAPNLIRSVRPVVPPEALRDFVTGNVTMDATIDSRGRVKSAKALAGPPVLRKAAVDAVKQYRYQPAMLNGKPVAAHLKVTMQFWFEP